ncbi:MAG: thiamine-phosphate kinase, partial [Candidatus Electrothrix sp. EH2]|nr:thiamine-phosphate kinase [Candidatus Electrothrix sp. EH2]
RSCSGRYIWVSGTLGYAAAGLDYFRAEKNSMPPVEHPSAIAPCIKAHLDPEARLGLGRALARSGSVHAMMDISDGLATDLSHLCTQSQTGALIEAEKLPGQEGLAAPASLLDRKSLDWMIAGGEDYELLFTAAPQDSQAVLAAAEGLDIRLTAVGSIRKEQGVALREKTTQGYKEKPVSFQGFDHFIRD